MGVFGTYENDNDSVYDAIIDINNVFFKKFKKSYSDDNDFKYIEQYITNNISELYNEIFKYIKKMKISNYKYNEFWYYSNIVGLVNIGILKELNVNNFNKIKKLPNNLPIKLKTIALNALIKTIQLDKLDNWKNKNQRITSLKHELAIYSNNQLQFDKIRDILKTKPLLGYNIVYSGFRDDNLTKKIKKLGGNIMDKITRSTNYLITKNDKQTTKYKYAKTHNIKIYELDKFIKLFNL